MFFYASSRIVLMLTATAFLPKSFQTKSRLLNLVPIASNFDDFLRNLNDATDAQPLLNQIKDENLEKLIEIRSRSIQLSLKSLNSLSLVLLRESFSEKNLKVKAISWTETSARTVEFVGKNDLVRPSDSWEFLKKRLDGKLFKCYGLFHEKVSEPVSFVYIKLHQGIPPSLQNIYNTDPDELNSCIFYSISSPFKGLNGIEFGSKLIKSVVETVKADYTQIKTFSTFSPLPLFRQWLRTRERFGHLTELSPEQLKSNEAELMAACDEYLRISEYDPVSRFHYRNGAKLGPIRFNGDTNNLGTFKQSYGIQVNYIYYD